MNLTHRFGGSWTEEKLERVRKYLSAYTKIFTRNVAASWYKTVYLDAFAGTGFRAASCKDSSGRPDCDFLVHDDDALSFQKGSAYAALRLSQLSMNIGLLKSALSMLSNSRSCARGSLKRLIR